MSRLLSRSRVKQLQLSPRPRETVANERAALIEIIYCDFLFVF
jgi:hypothetical protein